MKFAGRILGATALLVAFVSAASADTILTSEVGYTGRGLDLSAFANGNYNFTFGPINVDGFVFTSANGGGNSGLGSVVGQGGYGLGANGSFGGNAVYIGVDSATGYAQLLGTTGYTELGFFMNYGPGFGNPATISSLDALGNVISTFNLETVAPISTPGGFNQFEFRGIEATSPDSIFGLRFGGDYILLTGTSNGVPTPPSDVPEPLTLSVLAAGVIGLAGQRRRRAAGA